MTQPWLTPSACATCGCRPWTRLSPPRIGWLSSGASSSSSELMADSSSESSTRSGPRATVACSAKAAAANWSVLDGAGVSRTESSAPSVARSSSGVPLASAVEMRTASRSCRTSSARMSCRDRCMASATVDGGVDRSLRWTAAMSSSNSSADTAAMPVSFASSADSSSSICHWLSVGTRSAAPSGMASSSSAPAPSRAVASDLLSSTRSIAQ